MGEVKIKLLADISDIENKIGSLDNSLKGLHINLSTDKATGSIREVEKELNNLNRKEITVQAGIGTANKKEAISPGTNTADNVKKSEQDNAKANSSSTQKSRLDTIKFFRDVLKLLNLGVKLKSGKLSDARNFVNKLNEIRSKYSESSPHSKDQQKDNEQNLITPLSGKKENQDVDRFELPNKHLQELIQALNLGTKAISNIGQSIYESFMHNRPEEQKNQSDSVTPSKSSDSANSPVEKREHSPEVQSYIEQSKAIKEEISRLRIESKQSGNTDIKRANDTKIQNLLGQKKNIESNIRKSKIAEKAANKLGADTGKGDTTTVISDVAGKVAGNLLRTFGKSLLGTGGKIAGAGAGAAAGASGAAGAGILAAGSKAFPIAGIALTAAAIIGKRLLSDVKEGSGKVLSTEAKEFQVLGKTNYYGSKLEQGRREWYDIGKNQGYSAEESLHTAGSYMKKAGYYSMDALKQDVSSIQQVSKIYGLDPSQTASATGDMNKMGVFGDGEQRKFVNLLSDAIQKNGMRGREEEQIEVMRSLAESMYAHQVEVSQTDLMGMMNLQSKMVDANEGFKGQKGADVITQLNEGIINGNDQIDRLLGWGTEYRGMEGERGRWAFEQQKGKGVGIDSEGGMENLAAIVRNFEELTGKSAHSDEFKLLLKNSFGLETNVVDELLSDPKFIEFIKNGQKSADELAKSIGVAEDKNMPTDIEQGQSSYEDTTLYAKEHRENATELSKQDKGSFVNTVTKGWDEFLTGFDEFFSSTGHALGGSLSFENQSNSDGDITSGNPSITQLQKDFEEKGYSLRDSDDSNVTNGSNKVEIPIEEAPVSNKVKQALFGSKPDNDSLQSYRPTLQQKYQSDLLDREWKIVCKREELSRKDRELISEKSEHLEEEEQLKQKNEILKTASDTQQKTGIFDAVGGIIGKLFGRGAGSSSGISGGSSSSFGGLFEAGKDMISNMFGVGSSDNSKAEGTYQFSGSVGGAVAANGLNVNTNMRREHNLTAEQLNEIIDQKVANSEKNYGRKSLLRGQGKSFIEASEATGIHPVDILAQAAHETAWGTSRIAHEKKNFFGIGAFDASPYASAYSFGEGDGESDASRAGIIEGAKWVAKNYVDKGQDSFYKLRWNNGTHEYATDKDYDKKLNDIRQAIYGNLPADAVAPKPLRQTEQNANVPKLAIGHNYIPYDGYKAELHKGEAVLTRYEAEKHREGKLYNNIQNNSLSNVDSQPITTYATNEAFMENSLPYNILSMLSGIGNGFEASSTQNINLNVTGKIFGMDKQNQEMVTSALQQYYAPNTSPYSNEIMTMLENGTVRRIR